MSIRSHPGLPICARPQDFCLCLSEAISGSSRASNVHISIFPWQVEAMQAMQVAACSNKPLRIWKHASPTRNKGLTGLKLLWNLVKGTAVCVWSTMQNWMSFGTSFSTRKLKAVTCVTLPPPRSNKRLRKYLAGRYQKISCRRKTILLAMVGAPFPPQRPARPWPANLALEPCGVGQ